MKILFFLFSFLSLITICFANPTLDDKIAYTSALDNFLILSKNYINLPLQTREDSLKFKEAIKKVNAFTLNYPQSKYTDDANFIIVGVEFIDALTAQEEQASRKLIREMKKVLKNYPNLQLEPVTIQSCQNILNRRFISLLMALPYEKIVDYMNGWWGWEFKDYQLVVDNYRKLKDSLDFKGDKYGLLAEDIYLSLVMAYQYLDKKKEALAIAYEAISRFPDNRILRKFMKRTIKDIGGEIGVS